MEEHGTRPMEACEIILRHQLSCIGAVVPVYPANTLDQVARGYGDLIGLNLEQSRFSFSSRDRALSRYYGHLTIAEMGIGPGDTLYVC